MKVTEQQDCIRGNHGYFTRTHGVFYTNGGAFYTNCSVRDEWMVWSRLALCEAVAGQGFDVGRGSRGQTLQVVAAFQRRYQTAAGMFVGDLQQQRSQFRKIFVGQRELSQRIAPARIETG